VIQVTCTTCLEARLRDGLCRCVAQRLRYSRAGRARVMPWSDDASGPGYGVDVVARKRVAQSSRELIRTPSGRIAPRLARIRRHRHGNAEGRRPAPKGDRRRSVCGRTFVRRRWSAPRDRAQVPQMSRDRRYPTRRDRKDSRWFSPFLQARAATRGAPPTSSSSMSALWCSSSGRSGGQHVDQG